VFSKSLPRIFILMTVALLLVAVSAVGAQDDDTLRVGMNAPVVLDPALYSNDPEVALGRAIYDYLIDIQSDGSVVPDLASEWTVSDDALTYTFTLHDGVTFHDGSPLTSADVVFTFNRLVELGSPATGLLGEFEVSATDDATVVFTLPEINADFLFGVGSRWALILPDGQETPNELADGDNPYVNFNGTGPFMIEEFSAENRTVFVANPNYWMEGAPGVAQMEHIYIEDPTAQVDALLSGELDFIFKVPLTQIDRLEGVDGISVVERATARHPVIRLRTDVGPGTEVGVRQALKYATDRDALNDILLSGLGSVGNNDPIGPVYGTFYDDSIENPTYDPEMACQLLSDAGFPEGLEMTLFTPDSLEYPDLVVILQQQWQDTGCINVAIEVRPENIYYDNSNPENWLDVELGLTGWGTRPVPQQFLQEAYVSDGPFNESRWNDADLDALIAEARVTPDIEARAEIYSQISQLFNERGPIIIPYFAPMVGGVSDRAAGVDMNPFPGRTDYRTASISG
jgi:peptide/nickel transport system substrate-binding protein